MIEIGMPDHMERSQIRYNLQENITSRNTKQGEVGETELFSTWPVSTTWVVEGVEALSTDSKLHSCLAIHQDGCVAGHWLESCRWL